MQDASLTQLSTYHQDNVQRHSEGLPGVASPHGLTDQFYLCEHDARSVQPGSVIQVGIDTPEEDRLGNLKKRS